MAISGSITTPQTLPNPQVLQQGQMGTRNTAFLRSTPRVFTVVMAGQSNQDFHIRATAATSPQQVSLLSRRFQGAGNAPVKFGDLIFGLTLTYVVEGRNKSNSVTFPLAMGFSVSGAVPGGALYPATLYDIAFQSQPLTVSPTWTDASLRVRELSLKRGRSYEFDRIETGTAAAMLSNRDAALSPANTASPFAPLKATRPVRAQVVWEGITYPLFRGISEGYPQAYPGLGKDAVVAQQSSDLFYALNRSGFSPGSTTLTTALAIVPAGTVQTITVGSTALPMPQTVPFDITIDDGTVAKETMTVTAIASTTQYTVTRGATPQQHIATAPVSTLEVSFGQALSGTRIQQVLERAGFSSSWYDLDAGQSVMTASADLATVSPLEHINLIAEAEFGRFFVSRDGKFTFRDRHSIILDFLTPVVTFRDLPVTTEIPYRLEGALEHSEEKLFNRVRITIPSGEVVDVKDQASIDEHFERVFEREWPYANLNDAVSAAQFVLDRQSTHTLRLPQLVVHPANNPGALWPLVLAREIGDRCRFRYLPEAGGTEINQEVVIEGIGHAIRAKSHAMSFQLTEADPNDYWILGTTGYSELGQTTFAAF